MQREICSCETHYCIYVRWVYIRIISLSKFQLGISCWMTIPFHCTFPFQRSFLPYFFNPLSSSNFLPMSLNHSFLVSFVLLPSFLPPSLLISSLLLPSLPPSSLLRLFLCLLAKPYDLPLQYFQLWSICSHQEKKKITQFVLIFKCMSEECTFIKWFILLLSAAVASSGGRRQSCKFQSRDLICRPPA